ncbi:MAG: hypothetical protein H0X72_05115, partial [Acidobacteria bacterium]|nr:hypothetical protein [Acidobacteriota bacterium]
MDYSTFQKKKDYYKDKYMNRKYMNRKKNLSTLLSIIAILLLSVLATTQAQAQTCTPTTTVSEGDLAPGGIPSFGVSSGAGSVTVDHVNAGTGLQSFTVVNATNAVV